MKAGGQVRGPLSPDPTSGEMRSSPPSVSGPYLTPSLPPPDHLSLYRIFANLFRSIGAIFLPSIFGAVPAIVEKSAEYEEFQEMSTFGGARVFYNIADEGKRIVLAGMPHDLASFMHVFLNDPKAWLPGGIVDNIRADSGPAADQGFRFGTGEVMIARHYNPQTHLYEVLIEKNVLNEGIAFEDLLERFHKAREIFEKKERYEIEESSSKPITYSGIMGAFNRVTESLNLQQARQLRMILNRTPFFGLFGASQAIGSVDVGVRLNRFGRLRAVVLRIREGDSGDSFEFRNEALWTGVLDGQTIYWGVENSNRQEDGAANQNAFLSQIIRLFKPDISHVFVSRGRLAALEILLDNRDGRPPAPPGQNQSLQGEMSGEPTEMPSADTSGSEPPQGLSQFSIDPVLAAFGSVYWANVPVFDLVRVR